jgi:hypothetical protein
MPGIRMTRAGEQSATGRNVACVGGAIAARVCIVAQPMLARERLWGEDFVTGI